MAAVAMDVPRTMLPPGSQAYPASVQGSYMQSAPGQSAPCQSMAPVTHEMVPTRQPITSHRPQALLDSDPADGIVSVAYNLQKELTEIRARDPSPATLQYIHREAAIQRERQIQNECHPASDCDVCGWIMATSDPNGSYGGQHPDNDYSADRMNLHFDNFRLVFQCVSGTALMHWASQEDFKIGIFGARRAPRPLAWWDLRKAYDVVVQPGDRNFDIAAGQFTVLMYGGNLSFAVESQQDMHIWYNAVRGVIRDAAWHQATRADRPELKRKRWHCAVGLASALLADRPVGSRALAVAFHCFDTDMDCILRLGEVMLMILDLTAALLNAAGLAEGATMDLAMASAASRLPRDLLFEKALAFRRRCDQSNDGRIGKDEFVAHGHEALLDAAASV
ncbi:unnamed protein product [Effrenium voratum]|nr:unnamed protein product [Effrenium voratum]